MNILHFFNLREEWPLRWFSSYQRYFFSFRSGDYCLIYNRTVNLCPVMGAWPPLSRNIGQKFLLLNCSSWTATIVSLKRRARNKTVYSQYLISHALLVLYLFGTIIILFFLFYPFGMGMSNLFFFYHFILEAYNLLGFISWGHILTQDESYLEFHPCLI